METVVSPGLALLSVKFPKPAVLRSGFLDCFQRCGHFLGVHEINYCCFRVAPRQIRQNLIYRLEVLFRATPKLAFGDEVFPAVGAFDAAAAFSLCSFILSSSADAGSYSLISRLASSASVGTNSPRKALSRISRVNASAGRASYPSA